MANIKYWIVYRRDIWHKRLVPNGIPLLSEFSARTYWRCAGNWISRIRWRNWCGNWARMSTVAFPTKSSLGDVWPCDRKSRRLGLANDGAVHITPTRQSTCLPAATTVSVRIVQNRPNFRDRSFRSTTINYRDWGEPDSLADSASNKYRILVRRLWKQTMFVQRNTTMGYRRVGQCIAI